MKNRTCCFTGHRNLNSNTTLLKQKLKLQIIELIKDGYIYFGAGGARGFDTIAAKTILELKSIYPKIKLILVLPCLNQTKGWNKKDIIAFEALKRKADKIKLLSKNYYDGCMQARNRHLVNNSSVCLCYLEKSYGGTFYTVAYAKRNGLKIINLAD